VPSGESIAQTVRSRRAWQLSAIILLAVVILAGRLFHLQVLGAEANRVQANKNRIRSQRITAPRGLILDRDDRVLAGSRPSYTVNAVPVDLLRNDRALDLLSTLLEVPREDILARLSTGSRYRSRVVRRDVSFEHISRVAEREEELPGVSVDVASVRSYPYGSLAAHVLGHVGEVSEAELPQKKKNGKGAAGEPEGEAVLVERASSRYRAGDFVGRMGLERVHEPALQGYAGERQQEVDARGRLVGPAPGLDPVPAQPGRTLRLYLDAPLQAMAESLLEGRRGAIVFLDTETGGVRVLASSPTFDPNLFATGIGAKDWQALNTDPERPLLNRTVQAQYAPGSTFKMISAALALENGLVGFHQELDVSCVGGYQFGNRWFRCWEDLGHGKLTMEAALVRSCDVYFYQLAERASVDDLAAMARAAGLGAPTGIDLPQEASGNVPTAKWLDDRYGVRQWTQGTMLNLIIGQGEYLVTPLQMACYAATLANGGRRVVPRLVAEVEDKNGDLRPVPPAEAGRWELSRRTMSRLREAMRLVVEDEKGTGRVCRVKGYMPAGKTGTAENPHGAPHSWFVGYAPYDAPEVAFAVIVEGGGHGSDVAAPMVRKLLTEIRGPLPPDEDAS
jgi:penicillin-binding protein 2